MKKEIEEVEENSEESELEKEIEEVEEKIQDEDEIFDEDIVEFIPSTNKISTLKQINISEEPVQNLEENLRKTTHLPDEDDSFNYANKKKDGESKYQNFDTNYSSEMITTIEKMRNEKDTFSEVGFIESHEAKISPERNFEKYEQIKRFDKEEFRKQTELERKEIKYKPLN